MDNKSRISAWLCAVVVAIWALLLIITCAGVWNSKPDTFVGICAGLLALVNAYCIYKFIKAEKDSARAAQLAQEKEQEAARIAESLRRSRKDPKAEA